MCLTLFLNILLLFNLLRQLYGIIDFNIIVLNLSVQSGTLDFGYVDLLIMRNQLITDET